MANVTKSLSTSESRSGAKAGAAPKRAKKATRTLARPAYKSFRLSKRIHHPQPGLPTGRSTLRTALRILWSNKNLFGLMSLLYMALTLFFVHGFGAQSRLTELKAAYEEALGGKAGLGTGFDMLGTLLGNGNNPMNDVGGVYQTIFLLLFSLATIWAIRQTTAGTRIRLRDTFYKGMYPLVPFVLVLLVAMLQLLPFYLGATLYLLVVAGGLAVTALELALWLVLVLLLVLWSLYMVTSSVFALYIVTLPDIAPLAALRSAKRMVQYRRWLVMRRILFMPVVLGIAGTVLLVPIIVWLTPAAEWIFVALSVLVPLLLHAYMYSLYRELISQT